MNLGLSFTVVFHMRRLIQFTVETTNTSSRVGATLILLVGAIMAHGAPTASGVEVDCIMYQDPTLPKPAIEVRFPPNLVPTWAAALKRPERDLKRRLFEARRWSPVMEDDDDDDEEEGGLLSLIS